jgi:YesN/AraC family two-component response regulator
MTVIGDAADGATAVELAHRLHPDVVLADIRMPGLDGLEITRLLRHLNTPPATSRPSYSPTVRSTSSG